jgi:hypothetical protein
VVVPKSESIDPSKDPKSVYNPEILISSFDHTVDHSLETPELIKNIVVEE